MSANDFVNADKIWSTGWRKAVVFPGRQMMTVFSFFASLIVSSDMAGRSITDEKLRPVFANLLNEAVPKISRYLNCEDVLN